MQVVELVSLTIPNSILGSTNFVLPSTAKLVRSMNLHFQCGMYQQVVATTTNHKMNQEQFPRTSDESTL